MSILESREDHRERMAARRAAHHKRRVPFRGRAMIVYNTGVKRGGIGGRRAVTL